MKDNYKDWQDIMINCFGPNWLKETYNNIEIGKVAKYAANLSNQNFDYGIQEDLENKLKDEIKELKKCAKIILASNHAKKYEDQQYMISGEGLVKLEELLKQV